MKKTKVPFIGLALLAAALVAGGCNSSSYPTKPGGGNNGGGSGGTQVAISGFSFSSLTVSAGATVTWKNDDSVAHTATSDAGSAFQFDTESIAPGATSRGITFTQAGTFPYHCTFHPGMHGSITVH